MAGYRVTKLPEGTLVTYWPDPRGPGHGHCEAGYVEAMAAQVCSIVWAGYMVKGEIVESEITGTVEQFMASRMKYLEDRGLMRFKRPPKQRRVRLPDNLIECKQCGVTRDIGCDCPRPGALKPEFWGQKSVTKVLTLAEQDDSMTSSIDTGEGNPTQKGAIPMAKTKKPKEVEVDDDFVELDEVEETEDEADDPTEGKLSAKEAASKIGTDARTLRKFLRSKSGKIGQGNRWLIDPDDLDDLKREFEASRRPRSTDDEGDEDTEDEPKPKAKKPKAKSKAKAKSTDKSNDEIYGSADEDEDPDEDDDDEFEVLDEIDDL